MYKHTQMYVRINIYKVGINEYINKSVHELYIDDKY